MQSTIQFSSKFYELISPRVSGGWKTSVLALHAFLPPCPAED